MLLEFNDCLGTVYRILLVVSGIQNVKYLMVKKIFVILFHVQQIKISDPVCIT